MGLFSKDKKPQFIDVERKKENLKILMKTGRSKEAIAYIYLIYNDLIKNKYDKPRLAYQTIREYAITCVNELDQKPETIYPFIKKIEDIIYGGLEPTKKEFEFTMNMFSNLYNEITGKNFNFST
ncbi:MAG: hypothetical protein BAJALOKI3v1_60005 [Promethearchaeota archaeon]|jgi:hypothetical protein|nr:MAG: hypothetical protein BAJALOKI3v1_60005 [Candidatus Lokiarchaeota archaeon]